MEKTLFRQVSFTINGWSCTYFARMTNLGNVLRFLRLSRRWSVSTVADELDISRSGYYKIEQNLSTLSLTRLEQLAQLYDMKVSELLAMAENYEQSNWIKKRYS